MAPDPLALLKDGTAEIVPEGGLEEKLALGRPLRVKLGLDPTASDVTLGWAVVLHKLRQFQDAGHVAVLIVGDFTARVGDPSGKSETRPRLDKDVVRAFAEHMLEQFRLILSDERLEIRYNSEWLEGMDMEGVLRLTSSYTVAQMLQRDDFAKRHAEGRPISIMEFMYPLLQGYDSVAVEADIELGGTDQLFNLLVGRELQRAWGQAPQIAVTVPLIEGLDGVQKMSQSLGNYVGITEPADEMFGKLMRIPDELIGKYLRLVAWVPSDEAARRMRRWRRARRSRTMRSERWRARWWTSITEGGRGSAQKRGSTGSTGTVSSPRWFRTSRSRTEPPRTASYGCRGCSLRSTWPPPTATPAGGSSREGSSWTTSQSRILRTRPDVKTWSAWSCRWGGAGSAVWPRPG